MRARGAPVRRGEVLLACDACWGQAATREIRRLQLDCQLVYNRAALMILPAGVSKGQGLFDALGELGVSHHNTVAVGDAENDLALLEVAEVGVATGNAVPSLKTHADLVLDLPDGAGVRALLRGPFLSGQRRLCPARHWIRVEEFPDGRPVTVPGSQANILIEGETGHGKSHLAGLLAERWIEAGYSVLVLDPEGDHTALATLRGVRVVDGADRLPAQGSRGAAPAAVQQRRGRPFHASARGRGPLRHRPAPRGPDRTGPFAGSRIGWSSTRRTCRPNGWTRARFWDLSAGVSAWSPTGRTGCPRPPGGPST
jgi:hypothetical protein